LGLREIQRYTGEGKISPKAQRKNNSGRPRGKSMCGKRNEYWRKDKTLNPSGANIKVLIFHSPVFFSPHMIFLF
jgi:hypothetical protein|tara:strand:- start:365 stop:586 length:222 start_codon:yes stop_codon:yes gene_type:complete